jgi:predicted PurR-regulated permease PerM
MMDWLGPLVAPLTTAGIAVVLVIFILLSREDQRNRLLQLFGATHLHASTEALTDVTERVSKYLRMQFLINAGYGIAVGAGLWAIGVPSALVWGVLSFSLRFLPYIGPWLSAIMPLFVSIADSEGWTQPMLVVAWFTILELIVNNVAEPLLYGARDAAHRLRCRRSQIHSLAAVPVDPARRPTADARGGASLSATIGRRRR